jgi:DNA-binding LacI/PurR family transcriptional regulator
MISFMPWREGKPFVRVTKTDSSISSPRLTVRIPLPEATTCLQFLSESVLLTHHHAQCYDELPSAMFSRPSLAGEEAGRTLLALREPPTAIVCMNDLLAKGVMDIAKKQGIRCPHDLSIVGFDDLDIAEHLDTPLTTIRQPVNEIAETVVDILLEKLKDSIPDNEKAKSVFIQPELIIRSSTAAPPSD